MKEIHIWGIKQNNLKNIEIKVPIGSFTVICGPSGSGKSSVAFETLFAEGQRRFIESMSNYARQFLNKAPKPDIEGVSNIPPAISIEQKNTIKSSRSTVGTTTEVIDYLRLLFEKLAIPFCPDHNVPCEKLSVTEAADRVLTHLEGERGYILIEVSKDHRVLQGKKLHSLLLQDGFLRIAKKKDLPAEPEKKDSVVLRDESPQAIELSEPAILKKGLPAESFYLMVDRVAFTTDERGRLVDSITQAYEASVKYNTGTMFRSATVITTTGRKLLLSEEKSCPVCMYTPPPVTARLFSFNSPLGACPSCKGFGNILTLDEAKVIPNPKLSIAGGVLHPFTMPSAANDFKQLISYCRKSKIDINTPWEELDSKSQKKIWNGDDKFFGIVGLFEYLEQMKYKMHVRVFISRYRSPVKCPDCKGSRLRSETKHIRIGEQTLPQLSALTIDQLQAVFKKFKWSAHQNDVAGEILRQINSRLDFLMRVGVHYLSLDRETRTLSGGEYQRLLLANQLGMGLSQTLYVLDEPTVGLHPRDNERLISILKDLKDLGNTLVVVEHDHDVIKASENLIEMGPGSGSLGGEVMFSGLKADFLESNTLTAQHLRPQKNWTPSAPTRPVEIENYRYKINLKGCTGHNLKNISVEFPLNRIVTVTGVSGSGKSTLVTKTLYPALARELDIEHIQGQPFKKMDGAQYLKNVVMIDQSPIGRSVRSSPVTYLKIFDAIRTAIASTPEAKFRGYTPGTFSLNVDGGRCPACKGSGFEEIDMQFMDNVIVPCDVCDSKKYRNEILEIEFNKKNIHEILQMTVFEAMNFFVSYPNIRKPLAILKEVGLEYLTLGQSSASLSGGESQRLKVAKELSQVNQKATLYILDEPTTGLHFREVDLLMKVLGKLVEAGASVLLVEHNQDVIAASDYIIDIGPEAGAAGGQIVAEGTPTEVMKIKKSLTGQYLKRHLTEMNRL